MDAAEVDRKVLRAIAFKGRGCTLDEIKGSWGLDNEDVAASLTRLQTRSLLTKSTRGQTTWEPADRKDETVKPGVRLGR